MSNILFPSWSLEQSLNRQTQDMSEWEELMSDEINFLTLHHRGLKYLIFLSLILELFSRFYFINQYFQNSVHEKKCRTYLIKIYKILIIIHIWLRSTECMSHIQLFYLLLLQWKNENVPSKDSPHPENWVTAQKQNQAASILMMIIQNPLIRK